MDVLRIFKILLLLMFVVITTNKPLSVSAKTVSILFISLPVAICFSIFFDQTIAIILTSITIVLLIKYTMLIKNDSHDNNTMKSKTQERYQDAKRALGERKQVPATNAVEHDQDGDVIKYFGDPVKQHIQLVEKKLVLSQTNIFDPINYNLYFNNLKTEQYNTQGTSTISNNGVNGYDRSIYLIA